MVDRAVGEERLQPARQPSEHILQSNGGVPTDGLGRQIGRTSRQKAVERSPRDEAPFEQQRQPFARTRHAELREHEGDVGIGAGDADQAAQRVVQRLFDESRDFRLVRHVERRDRDPPRAETRGAATGRTRRWC